MKFFFNTDVKLLEFLEKVHEGDEQKYFKHLSSEEIEEARKSKGNGVQIAGCQKSHMISLFPDGSWQIKRHICSCCSCKRGKFNECDGELSEHNTPDEEIIDNDLDLLDETDNPEMLHLWKRSLMLLCIVPLSL